MKPFIYSNKNLIIELNYRQTGKSTRMVENIIKYIDNTNNDVFILSINNSTYLNMKNSIHKMCSMKKLNNIYGNKVKKISNMNGLTETDRVYVDEFLHVRNIDNVIKIRDNMYFTGSTYDENTYDTFILNEIKRIKQLIKSSPIIKKLTNIVHRRRKEIIDKLLNEN